MIQGEWTLALLDLNQAIRINQNFADVSKRFNFKEHYNLCLCIITL